jgi:hypothetical protein
MGQGMSSVSGELAGELFVWSMIAGIGVATFLIRFAPIALLARLELPAWLHPGLALRAASGDGGDHRSAVVFCRWRAYH